MPKKVRATLAPVTTYLFNIIQFGSLGNLHLPKKKSFRNTDKNFLQKRKHDLDVYLQVTLYAETNLPCACVNGTCIFLTLCQLAKNRLLRLHNFEYILFEKCISQPKRIWATIFNATYAGLC